MNKKWLILIAPIAIALFVWLGGEVVMYLWNWLLPMLFGLHVITFWQAIGILILSRILFGGWAGGGNHSGHRERKRWHWQRMSPEEHEKFKEWTQSHPAGFSPTQTGGAA